MDEIPFPQYRKGVPKAGLDEVTHFMLAVILAAFPYFFMQLLLGDWGFAPVVSGAVAWASFRFVMVPIVRYIFQQLPPVFLEHYVATVYFRGGLTTRPDPEPIPFKVD
ncbi:hypothetical protein IHN63_01305 [Deinococcus sp. 6YEL10]|nr:hypothetical protein [Deinococcus sp. 6YEL10]